LQPPPPRSLLVFSFPARSRVSSLAPRTRQISFVFLSLLSRSLAFFFCSGIPSHLPPPFFHFHVRDLSCLLSFPDFSQRVPLVQIGHLFSLIPFPHPLLLGRLTCLLIVAPLLVPSSPFESCPPHVVRCSPHSGFLSTVLLPTCFYFFFDAEYGRVTLSALFFLPCLTFPLCSHRYCWRRSFNLSIDPARYPQCTDTDLNTPHQTRHFLALHGTNVWFQLNFAQAKVLSHSTPNRIRYRPSCLF